MTPTFYQVSGGRTSGYMAFHAKDDPNGQFMFQNTGMEREETYDFLNRMDKEFGLNLIWLEYYCPDPAQKATFKVVNYETADRNGVPFAQLIAKRKAIPNKHKRFCSPELKVKTARRWIRAQGFKKWNYAIGYRADGKDATRPLRSDTMQTAFAPLREKGITIREVSEFWHNNSFDLDLPMLPNGKTFGGNCRGCFWHSEYQHAHLCKHDPKARDWLIRQEKKMGYRFNDNYSYEELNAHVEKYGFDMLSDMEGFCMETNGSCGT